MTASHDKTVRVWDSVSGRLVRVLRPPIGTGAEGEITSVAIHPSGSTVAVAVWTAQRGADVTQVTLFERESGRVVGRLSGADSLAAAMRFSPDGRWLASCSEASDGVHVWDWRAGGQPHSDREYAGACLAIAWGANDRFATTSRDGAVRLYRHDAQHVQRLSIRAPGSGLQPLGIAFSPDGRELAVGAFGQPRVEILDAETLVLRHAADVSGVTVGDLAAVAWGHDGRTLYAGGDFQSGYARHVIRAWSESGRGAYRDIQVSRDTIRELIARTDGAVVVAGSDKSVASIAPNGEVRALTSSPTADYRDVGQRFRLSDDGRRIQFGFEVGGGEVHRFDLAARQLTAGGTDDGRAPRTSAAFLTGWQPGTPPVVDGRPLALGPSETARSISVAPDAQSFVLGLQWTLGRFDRSGKPLASTPAPGVVWAVNQDAGGRVVVAAYADGTIRWHRASDLRELLAFFPHADRKRWVLWTPSGYYDASVGGEDLIGWHVNRGIDEASDFFPASQFRTRFWRPDVIDRILETLDEDQALSLANRSANRQGGGSATVAQALPPVIELLSAGDVDLSQTTLAIRYRVRTAADAPVTDTIVRVDGQAVAARGLQRPAAAAAGGAPSPAASEQTVTVELPPRNSEVQLFVQTRHGTSTAATVRVSWTGSGSVSSASGFRIQPKLYVLAVGVGQYQHKDIPKLRLPGKDVRDFVATMRTQKGRLYRDVEVRQMVDSEATKDRILDGLDWLQRSVTQHDVAMVFLSGHGVIDQGLGYTFLPVNADPDGMRRSTVGMSEFRQVVSTLPGKVVFFLDTCHSGDVLGPARKAAFSDVTGTINELASAQNGVVVFSSSLGRQFSYEDPAWGNGAFTKALNEGLSGSAAYQRDGRVTHVMLNLYVSERVKELTRGRQIPVAQTPAGVPDFPLAVVGP